MRISDCSSDVCSSDLHASCLSQGTSLAHIICRAGRFVASGHRSFAASRLFSDAAVRRRLPVREHARLQPHRDPLRTAQGFILDAPEPHPPEPLLPPDCPSMDMHAAPPLVRLLTTPSHPRGTNPLPPLA